MSHSDRQSGEAGTTTPFAVIDVGSNSIRLVVFDGLRRHPHILFNEKVLCGLGADVAMTGRLAESAMARGLETLRRFALLLEAMQARAVDAVATAAVREAENGRDLLQRVRAETGLAVRILDGAEEARLSALGVLSGVPRADGIIGDLGGGSLELVQIRDGEIGERVTLPFGTLTLSGRFGADRKAIRAALEAAFDTVPWLTEGRGRAFYMVGGTWRALSRIHMVQERAALPILHGFCLRGPRARTLARLVARQHPESLSGIGGVSPQRLESVPVAALVLNRLLQRIRPGKVVTSALGLREGLLFDRLGEELRSTDPLLAAACDLAREHGRFGDPGERLMRWIAPLFDEGEDPEMRRLRRAACHLADIAWRGHPDFRAERAVMEILYGHLYGLDHRGRGVIGLILHRAYGGADDAPLARQCRQLVDCDDIEPARRAGAAIRLAQRLSGGTAVLLDRCRLVRREGRLVLETDPGHDGLLGAAVMRRLGALGALLGVPVGIGTPAAGG
ncbi:MAG: hypothetical protein ACE5ED_09580 [Rhodothalassiaceae bacterium]